MAVGQAMAADIRYMNSGDYLNNRLARWCHPRHNRYGPIQLGQQHWGKHLLMRFQMGVDESGQLVVNAGGKLSATGVPKQHGGQQQQRRRRRTN